MREYEMEERWCNYRPRGELWGGGGSGIWFVRFYVVVYRQSLVVIWPLLMSCLGFNNYSIRP